MQARTGKPSFRLLIGALVLSGALVGCGSPVTDNSPSAASTSSGGGKQTTYPLTVESCGVSQTFNAPPKRAVTLTSTATETMLELGLEDHMVGTSYLRGRKIGEKYADAFAKVPVLSEMQPSMEQLLAVNPDFVYSGYPDGFSKSNGHTREQLKEHGILTHLSPVGCTDEKKTIADETKEIALIGQIFNVNDRAEEAIARFNEKVDAVAAKVKDAKRPKVWLYNNGTDAPMTAGGWAYVSAMINAAGGDDILANEDIRWGKISWEQVATAAPDVIVIYDFLEPSADSKIQTLKNTPALANVPAIKNNKFVVVSLSLAQPGPRSAEGVEVLAKGFHPDRFTDK